MKSTCTRFAPVVLFLSLLVSLASLTLAEGTGSNKGTDLATNASVGSTVCDANNTSATVQVNVLFTSTGSTAPASVLVSTDGGTTFTEHGTVTNWSSSGRDSDIQLALAEILPANTTTQFEVCATQPGSNGNPDKNACANLSIDPICGAACNPPGTFGCTLANFITFCCPVNDVKTCVFNGNPVGTCM